MKKARYVLSVVTALFAILFIAIALTAPAITATTPAIFGIALAVAAVLIWPRKRTS